jgi:hypothetical protein
MSLITLVLVILLVGALVYVLQTYAPVAQPWKGAAICVIAIAFIAWMLFSVLGVSVPTVRVR